MPVGPAWHKQARISAEDTWALASALISITSSVPPRPTCPGAEDGPYLLCAGKWTFFFATAVWITESPTGKEGSGSGDNSAEEKGKDSPQTLLKAEWTGW